MHIETPVALLFVIMLAMGIMFAYQVVDHFTGKTRK